MLKLETAFDEHDSYRFEKNIHGIAIGTSKRIILHG